MQFLCNHDFLAMPTLLSFRVAIKIEEELIYFPNDAKKNKVIKVMLMQYEKEILVVFFFSVFWLILKAKYSLYNRIAVMVNDHNDNL